MATADRTARTRYFEGRLLQRAGNHADAAESFGAVLTLASAGCSASSSVSSNSEAANTKSPVDVVNARMDAYNQHDITTFMATYAILLGVIGGCLFYALKIKSRIVDDLVVNMVDVGEETGELDTMLYKVADTYDEEVRTMTDGLTALIEPLMIGGVPEGTIAACAVKSLGGAMLGRFTPQSRAYLSNASLA